MHIGSNFGEYFLKTVTVSVLTNQSYQQTDRHAGKIDMQATNHPKSSPKALCVQMRKSNTVGFFTR